MGDPNAPKKPAGGAYGVFLAENRAEIVNSLPKGHKMTDVAKAAGVQWRALSDAAKTPYEQKYQKKQSEYIKAVQEYRKANPGKDVKEQDDEDDEDEEDEAVETKKGAPPKKKSRAAGA